MNLHAHALLAPHLTALLKIAAGSVFTNSPSAELARSRDAVTNWEGGVVYRPAVTVKPRCIDDVVAVMRNGARFPSPVRAVGKLHSPAPCSADDGGTMLDMTGMSRIIEIGPDFVTAEAGALYIDVAEELARHGRQFHVNTEIGTITLGAAASAATKDSSLIETSRWGQVSSFVTALKVVRPDGSIVTYTEDEHPDEMRLLRSSYGLLGVIVEVTLRTKPTTAVYARHTLYSFAGFRAAAPELARQGYALMMYFYPFIDRVVVETRRELPGVAPTSSGWWGLRNAFWRTLGPMFAIWAVRLAPSPYVAGLFLNVVDAIVSRGTCWFVGGKRTDPIGQIIRHVDKPGDHKFVFSMWSFDEDGFFDTLDDYVRFCHEHYERTGFRCDLPTVGYRMVADANSLLSYSHDASAISIDPVSTGGPGWDAFLRAFNAFASERGGHPLFNQTKHLTASQVQGAFGDRWQQFAVARREWDPADRLLSRYFADLLGEQKRSPSQ